GWTPCALLQRHRSGSSARHACSMSTWTGSTCPRFGRGSPSPRKDGSAAERPPLQGARPSLPEELRPVRPLGQIRERVSPAVVEVHREVQVTASGEARRALVADELSGGDMLPGCDDNRRLHVPAAGL